MSRARDDGGHTSVLVIGFATILLLTIAVVINASAAFLHRQGLDNVADGAALQGADLGAAGVYEHGLGTDRLALSLAAARAAVDEHLAATGAYQRFPGLRAEVRVDPDGQSVTVRVTAPLDLPLSVSSAPRAPRVGATSTAAVRIHSLAP